MFRGENLGVQADQVRDSEPGGVRLQIIVDNLTGHMLSGLDAEGGRVHGEVRVFKRSQEVVALQARVQAIVGPRTAQAGLRVEYGERTFWLSAVKLLRGGQAIPSGANNDAVQLLHRNTIRRGSDAIALLVGGRISHGDTHLHRHASVLIR